jgi:uncharacterized protein YhhL (DUF1145 family)
MSMTKIVTLVIYVVLAGLALTQGDMAVGAWSLRLLGILIVVHAIETVIFFKLCQGAGGSLPMHLLNVFLFGIFHVQEIKAGQSKN